MLKIFKNIFNFKARAKRFVNMEDIIKPLYIVTSLLGLFPYSVKFQKSKNSFETINKAVYVNSLCGITIILTIFAFTALHIQNVFQSSENISMTEAIMTKMNYVLELITLVIFTIIVYTCAFLNRSKYVKLLNMIISTWCDIPINTNSQNILSNLKFHVNFIVMGSLMIATIIQCSVNFSRDNTIWKIILVTITFNLPQTIEFTALAFYYSLVMMLVAILANINEQCLILTKNSQVTVSEIVEVQAKSTVTLRQMELAYVKAFQIKTYINKAFQGPILACTLQCFHSVVSEAHIIYHGVVVGKTLTSHDVINCSIWIAYQIFKIYSLSYAGNLLKLEALKIGQTLHNIPTEKQDLRWLMEIQHFSSLMSYQKIEMTVYEYFPLDATLLYNMLASAMMYLIIFVQFDRRE